jgi:hypothetical protein
MVGPFIFIATNKVREGKLEAEKRTPSKAILEMLSQAAGSGVPTTVLPEHLGGFTR